MRRLLVTALACVAVVAGCGVDATPGEMTSQTYRSLVARGDDLTPQDVRDAGGVEDGELARTFVDEGGAVEPSGATCLFARTTYRDRYRGTARFCFDGERVVSAERNRADLDR
jgi:hypothetical protein